MTSPITDNYLDHVAASYETSLLESRITGTYTTEALNAVPVLLKEIERLRSCTDPIECGHEAALGQAKERFDAELVKRLTLPSWDEVEVELVSIYSKAPSIRDGLQGIYGRIQDMLVHELIAARAAMAGDDQ